MTYRHGTIELVCPTCRSDLERRGDAGGDEGTLVCAGCTNVYPVIFGIPDLRVFPDPYISIEGDQLKGRMLASRFAELDLEGIARTYYHITPETPAPDVELNIRRLRNAEKRAAATLAAWDMLFGPVQGDCLVDVGCGTAPLLVAARPRFKSLVGVDVSFRWLVMARRRLADAGISVPLVAACGEALPFKEGIADVVAMDSYLEITKDPAGAAEEAARVLRPGGSLLIATPNRFSIGPDPHIGVPGGGLLPGWLVNAIAKLRMARPPLRHLFSARSLPRMVRRAGFDSVRVDLPPVSDAQLAAVGGGGRSAARTYNRLRTAPVARQLLFAVGPMLHASARRP
jgi:ubiquinone/menaquinone biosynthesis C-methylase UbiE/uncharacterized protein YbaR (Trm112 family)